MKVKPVRTINPDYPQKNDLSSEQLKEAIPKRWTNTAGKFALGVLALFLLTGCKDESAAQPAPTQEPTNTVICKPTNGASDVIIVDGIETELTPEIILGMPTPPKTIFEHIFDSISDLLDVTN